MSEWISDDFQMPNYCKDCVHWHKRKHDPIYHLAIGDCDKIPKEAPYSDKLKYAGYSFEDECYDDVFHCFEGINEE